MLLVFTSCKLRSQEAHYTCTCTCRYCIVYFQFEYRALSGRDLWGQKSGPTVLCFLSSWEYEDTEYLNVQGCNVRIATFFLRCIFLIPYILFVCSSSTSVYTTLLCCCCSCLVCVLTFFATVFVLRSQDLCDCCRW